MKKTLRKAPWLAATAGILLLGSSSPARASSHMDAPLIILDDAANTTDVYAFLSRQNGQKYLTTALAPGWRRISSVPVDPFGKRTVSRSTEITRPS